MCHLFNLTALMRVMGVSPLSAGDSSSGRAGRRVGTPPRRHADRDADGDEPGAGGPGTGGREPGDQDPAALRQQRRLKQAIQFLHKDSADLLPLDGLKKLGTSTQGQPHHILQKRLLEAKLSRGRMNMANNGGVLLSCNHLNSHEDEGGEEEDFIYVPCKCLGQEMNVLIDTGCKLNLMSSLTVERLGLKELVDENKIEIEGFPLQRKLCIDGHIKELGLTIGRLRIICSFSIVESNKPLMSLGNKALKSLKCVIDTENQLLVFGTNVRDQVQFTKKAFGESSSDFTDLRY